MQKFTFHHCWAYISEAKEEAELHEVLISARKQTNCEGNDSREKYERWGATCSLNLIYP